MRTNKNADTNDEIGPSSDGRRNAQANLLGQNQEEIICDPKRVNQPTMIACKVHKTICDIKKHHNKYFFQPATNAVML